MLKSSTIAKSEQRLVYSLGLHHKSIDDYAKDGGPREV